MGLSPDRRCIRQAVLDTASFHKAEFFAKNKGGCCILCVDGGTLVKRTFLNFCVAMCQPNPLVLFWASFAVSRLDSETVKRHLSDVKAELMKGDIFPLAVVSDNASAMTKAIAGKKEQEEEDEDIRVESDSDDEGGFEPVEIDTVVDEAHVGDGFSVHVRCWAHSLQLCLGDAQKRHRRFAKAFGVVERIVKSLGRAEKEKLENILRAKGESSVRLVMPCVTRWNSHLRTMVRLKKIEDDVNLVLPNDARITPEESYEMHLAIVVLSPIAWATDAVQSDSCTVLEATAAIANVKAAWATLSEATYVDDKTKREVLDAISVVQSILREREGRNFDNELVRLLRFLDPKSDAGDATWATNRISAFWSARGFPDVTASVKKSIAEFQVRTPNDRSNAAYWEERRLTHPHVANFIQIAKSALMTEACVERSFASQSKVFSPIRNRMHEKLVNALMFVKAFCLRDPRRKATTSATVSTEEWSGFAQTLQVPKPKILTRHTEKQALAQNLPPGAVVRVAWNEGTGVVYYEALVIDKVGPAKYEVVYRGGKKKVTIFEPTGADNMWELVALPTPTNQLN